MPKSFNHPAWLTGTKEEQESETQRQALAMASFGRGHLTESERLIGRGALLEATARGNLEQSKGKDKEARILHENQLADALAMQGKYSEAAETHNDKDKRKYFRDVGAAIELDDSVKCDCPDSKAKINDVEIAVTPRFERARIFSPAHGQVISLVECSVCGHVNARPLRSRLLPMSAARNANEAIAQGSAERKAFLQDIQVLRA